MLLSGSGADGQRAGQRDRQTGHPGRDRESAKTNAEVHWLTHSKSLTLLILSLDKSRLISTSIWKSQTEFVFMLFFLRIAVTRQRGGKLTWPVNWP